jgi:putative transposase
MAEVLLDRSVARVALNSLLREREATGRASERKVRAMAIACGVDRSTIYRWLAAGEVPAFDRPSYQATEADVDAFFDHDGRYRPAWHARCADEGGPELFVSYDTYRRAVKARIASAIDGYAQDGRRAARARTLQIRQRVPGRNFLWVIDHKELDIPVMASAYHRRPAYPWLTSVVDVYSRAILGWVLSMRPTRAEVVKALADACTSRPERGPFSGGPLNIVHDTAPELNAEITTVACVLLGADSLPRNVWSPEPFIERYHRTIDQEFQVGKPFNRLGPKRQDGTVYGPGCDPPPLTWLRDEWESYVTQFNLERIHRGIGCTPATKFLQDDTPLRPVSENDIRLLQVERKTTRPIRPEGIEFRGRIYIHPEMTLYEGRRIEIGEWPHDEVRIDVFLDGQYLFTAEHRDQAPPQMIAQAYEVRKQVLSEGAQRMRAKSRRQGVRLRALQAGNAGPVITNAMTEEEARARRRDIGDPSLGSLTDLLGIGPTVNTPRTDGND